MSQADANADILQAALHVFAENGYRGTSIEMIAAEADVDTSTVLDCFDDKEDIYNQTLTYSLEKWHQRIASRAEEEHDPIDKLRGLYDEAFFYLSRNPETRRLMLEGPMMFLYSSERFASFIALGERLVQSVLEEGMESGVLRPMDCEKMSRLLYWIHKMYNLNSYMESPLAPGDDFFELLPDLIINGLIAGEGPNAG